MARKKKGACKNVLKPLTCIEWDSLPSEHLRSSEEITSLSLMNNRVSELESIISSEFFRKSETLFSRDYLSMFGLPLSNKGAVLERMCTPKEQHLLNNEMDSSFWRGKSVLACLFLFMQKSEQEEGLRRFFGPFGSIEEILVMGNHFAAIKFVNIISAIQAKKWILNPGYDGFYFPLNNPSSSLWVGNLHPDVTEEDLRSNFIRYGKIKTVRIFKWKYYAFINFRSLESAVDALDCMQGCEIRNIAIKLNFAGAK